MKWQYLTDDERYKIKMQANMKEWKWRVWFAWYPVRLDATTIVWLENVARRRYPNGNVEKLFGSVLIVRRPWIYGPAVNALTQPGVIDDFVAGSSVSAAQASSASIPSGSLSVAGGTGPLVLGAGNSNAGNPAPGGLNTPPPQPGP